MTTILKVGGSLLTDKTATETIHVERLQQVSTTLGAARPEELVLIHGGGSFGHRAAEDHGITTERGTRDARSMRAVMGAMDRLNTTVVEALLDEEVPAVGLPPRACAVKSVEGDLSLGIRAVRGYLAEGMVPVLHGDLVIHADRGSTVVSGDTLAVECAKALDADRVGLCTGAPGVLDETGRVINRVDAMDTLDAALSEPDGADVTGGMRGKIQVLLGLSRPAAIFGMTGLEAFLRGDLPGTIVGGPDADPF